jgi:hypothetical protein
MDVQERLYDFIGVLSITMDISLVVVPIPMLWSIQITLGKKVLVICLFAVRIMFVPICEPTLRRLIMRSVPPITIVQLLYLHQYFEALDDQTWSNIKPWILTQTVMNMSIITACIPSLRRVVTELCTNQTSVAVSEGMEFGTVRSEKSSRTDKSGSNPQSLTQVNTAAEEKQDETTYGNHAPHNKTRRSLAQITSGKRSPVGTMNHRCGQARRG